MPENPYAVACELVTAAADHSPVGPSYVNDRVKELDEADARIVLAATLGFAVNLLEAVDRSGMAAKETILARFGALAAERGG